VTSRNCSVNVTGKRSDDVKYDYTATRRIGAWDDHSARFRSASGSIPATQAAGLLIWLAAWIHGPTRAKHPSMPGDQVPEEVTSPARLYHEGSSRL
jgi:hypothetical protein